MNEAGVKYLRECAQSLRFVIAKTGHFPVDVEEGDGLKNRRLRERKSSIGHVPILRTLSLCGEVAERLKAAVC